MKYKLEIQVQVSMWESLAAPCGVGNVTQVWDEGASLRAVGLPLQHVAQTPPPSKP